MNKTTLVGVIAATLGVLLGIAIMAFFGEASPPAPKLADASEKSARTTTSIQLSDDRWDCYTARSEEWGDGTQIGIVAVSDSLNRLVYERAPAFGGGSFEMSFPGRFLLDQRFADHDGGRLGSDRNFNITEFWIATCDSTRTGGRVELYKDGSGKAEFANTTPLNSWGFPGELPVKTTWLPTGALVLLNTADASRVVHIARDSGGAYASTPTTFYATPSSGDFFDKMPFFHIWGRSDGRVCLDVLPNPFDHRNREAYRPSLTLLDDNQDLVADREDLSPALAALPSLPSPAYISTPHIVVGDTRLFIKHLADGRTLEARVGSEVLGSVVGTTNPRSEINLSRALTLGEEVHLYAPDNGAASAKSNVIAYSGPRCAWADDYTLSVQGDSLVINGNGFTANDYVTVMTDKGKYSACIVTFVSQYEILVATPDISTIATIGKRTLLLVSPTSDTNARNSSYIAVTTTP